MELFQLRAFLAVAEELHFGNAAKRLGMGQPPLSRTIRQLEDELGTPLFYRTTRTVSLSPAGETLVDHARNILDSCATTLSAIKEAHFGDTGTVRFGFSGASSDPMAARLASAVHRVKPGIMFHLETSIFATEGLTRLIDGTLDLALVRWAEKPAGIVGRPVMTEFPVVAVYQDHPLAAKKSVTIKDLKDEHLVVLPSHPRSSVRDRITEWFLAEGMTPNVVQEAADSRLIGALISEKMGITITYDSAVRGSNQPGVVAIPLRVKHEPLRVYLAHRDGDTNPALLEVLNTAQQVLPTVT